MTIALLLKVKWMCLALHEAGITNAISVPNGATLNSNNLRLS